ncbi:MAG TPA: hypothetical protein VIU15_40240 [Streptomyces sp.]
MKEPLVAAQREPLDDSLSGNSLYTAELVDDGGVYVLTVTDHVRGTRSSTRVPPKTVGKLPVYLSMLSLRQL